MVAVASFELPAGYRAAAAITVDVDAESGVLSEAPEAARRLTIMTHQRYGPTVGLGRLLRHVLSTAGIWVASLREVSENVASLGLDVVRHRRWDGGVAGEREG